MSKKIYQHLGAFAFAAGLFLCQHEPAEGQVQAPDWSVTVRVTAVDSSRAPDAVAFQANTDVGACLAGSWLTIDFSAEDISARPSDAQQMVNILQAANSSGTTIGISGINGGCLIQSISTGG